MSPDIDRRMSAALENIRCGESDLAEVTSLAGAVAAWQSLDPAHQAVATLMPERPLIIDGVAVASFSEKGIAAPAERLPPTSPAT